MEKVTVHTRSREIAEAAAKLGHRQSVRVARGTNDEGDSGWIVEGDWLLFEDQAEVLHTHIVHFGPARAIALLDVVEAAERYLNGTTQPGGQWELRDALARLHALNEADNA